MYKYKGKCLNTGLWIEGVPVRNYDLQEAVIVTSDTVPIEGEEDTGGVTSLFTSIYVEWESIERLL